MTRIFLWRLLCAALVIGLWGCSDKKPPTPDRGAPKQVALTIASIPPGAAVFDQGRDRLGVTPLTLSRAPGDQVRVTVIKEGFRAARRRLLVEGRPKQKLVVRLRKQTGMLVIKTGLLRGADVYVDGKRRGRSPLKVPVVLGKHVVEVRRSGTEPFKATVEVSKPKQKVVVNATLLKPGAKRKADGFLTVLSDQPAVITAGRILFGTTPVRRRPVPARSYALKLEAVKTRAVREVTVVVEPKKHATVRVSFAKPAKKKGSAKKRGSK